MFRNHLPERRRGLGADFVLRSRIAYWLFRGRGFGAVGSSCSCDRDIGRNRSSICCSGGGVGGIALGVTNGDCNYSTLEGFVTTLGRNDRRSARRACVNLRGPSGNALSNRTRGRSCGFSRNFRFRGRGANKAGVARGIARIETFFLCHAEMLSRLALHFRLEPLAAHIVPAEEAPVSTARSELLTEESFA